MEKVSGLITFWPVLVDDLWVSVLASLSVPLVFQPLNLIVAGYYTKAQAAVMAVRDRKTRIVTEALQGIRQIKFSATEPRWENIILAERACELAEQWRVYVMGIYLTFC